MKSLAKLAATLTVGAAMLSLVGRADAAVRCEFQYGVGEVCVVTGELQVDKEVFNPQERKFVDNLGLTSHRFAPGDEITFRIMTKNVGNATFSRVTVTDTLPSELQFISGNLNYTITDLSPGETDTREFRARVVSADRFPSDKSVICVINAVEARADSERDRDTAQVCLEKKVPAPAKLPEAGAEDSVLFLLSSSLLALFGLRLLRKANSIV